MDHIYGSVIDNVSAVRAARNGEEAVSWSKGQMQLATDAMGKVMSERRLKFPPKLRRRMYSDRQKAEALQLLSEINDSQRVSERTGVPRSTLSQWRIRYQTDEAFAQRIDLFLAAG
ncbi:MAG: transposase [Caldilineaceae bacterium]|nr:transposase [Caldilineaceae bacterium]MDE0463767.1 transposase [Caldilineaceae bacterium]